ncbi:T9SS type A sorting domain-containing protein [Aquimarina hainanensis]|uniref:T9SS type A sorting domain-containing protein n=1 Tax=Aquimarina hainanensis TaxID=1578017 RepID=A0ABW5N3W5_9FLAO|nr:T9SS type A sorting domain-containing protein [Aquimarina sp. TRL1]QKX04417.1 T9SS type A sorting domain-containing protein [Aquimarina sp. TRL1]
MKKIYLLLIFTCIMALSFTPGVKAQAPHAEKDLAAEISIRGLRIYPNPASANEGKLYITSASAKTKTITIFNVLGKKVLFKVLVEKVLDISPLNTGVYIIQVKEGGKSVTKKLIIN